MQEAHIVIKLTAISSEQEPHSTVAAFMINPGGDCHWVHSGDSRIYHFHGNKFVKRTFDHSYVQALVARGEITEEEANVHPQSNILMGCLGTEADPTLDIHFIPKLRAGDVLMACSDGVWHYFTQVELGSVLATLSAREATEFLIEKGPLTRARHRRQPVADRRQARTTAGMKLAPTVAHFVWLPGQANWPEAMTLQTVPACTGRL